mgnify:CR=1 FL=1
MSLFGLPDTFRLAIFNQTGATISNVPASKPTASGRRVRYDSTGALDYEASEFIFFSMAAANIANNSYVTGSTLTNTSLQYMGIDGLLSSFGPSACSGNLYLYMEASPDGGTTWPTPASANGPGGGLLIAAIGYGSTTTNSTASTLQRLFWVYP